MNTVEKFKALRSEATTDFLEILLHCSSSELKKFAKVLKVPAKRWRSEADEEAVFFHAVVTGISKFRMLRFGRI